MLIKISRRYARALFELGQEHGKIAVIRNNLSSVLNLISSSPEFESFLQNPALPYLRRKTVMDLILKKGFDELTSRFIRFLDHKNRLAALKGVCEVFEEYCLHSDGVVQVFVTSSSPLSKTQSEELARHLGVKFGKIIKSYPRVDPGLLGGLKVQRDDRIFDFSFSAQLERFRKNLMRA